MLDFNDLAGVARAFEQQGKDIAAVIVEPVAGNMNLVLPAPGFLEGLRELCTRHGAVLIFDEVMTGFRVGLQGAQGLLRHPPDLTTLGKVVGGGMPLAAPSAAGATSCKASRRSARCIRPARCREIRSRSPQALRR